MILKLQLSQPSWFQVQGRTARQGKDGRTCPCPCPTSCGWHPQEIGAVRAGGTLARLRLETQYCSRGRAVVNVLSAVMLLLGSVLVVGPEKCPTWLPCQAPLMQGCLNVLAVPGLWHEVSAFMPEG
jgi:hypothetical protein